LNENGIIYSLFANVTHITDAHVESELSQHCRKKKEMAETFP